jgi:hypothetical protein
MDDIAKELCFVADAQGWRKDLFIRIDDAFICAICKNVCRDCVELSCEIEHTDEEFEVYCVDCILTLLSSNGNTCPINGHPNPSYAVSRSSRARVLRSKVYCPNSRHFMDMNETTTAGGSENEEEDEEQEEGEGPGAADEVQEIGCEFEGNLNDLILRHINQCCISQAVCNPALQAKILARMKKTTKLLVQKIETSETFSMETKINAMLDRFHTDNNLKFEARSREVQQLREEYTNEKELEEKIESQIEANKQEIQQLKDSLAAMKRSFNNYKEQQSEMTLRSMISGAYATNSNSNNNSNSNSKEKDSSSYSNSNNYSTSGGKPFDSILMDSTSDMQKLVGWIPNGNSKQFVLKFRATRDGWPTATFHSKCDECPSSVVVVQGENNNLFGGFTSKTWDQAFRNWKTDNEAFIFLLHSADGSATPAKYTVSSASTAIYAHSSYGPNWGNGPDLEIKSDQNIVSDLENASCSYGAPKNNKIFSGVSGRSFRIKDYEVYEIK